MPHLLLLQIIIYYYLTICTDLFSFHISYTYAITFQDFPLIWQLPWGRALHLYGLGLEDLRVFFSGSRLDPRGLHSFFSQHTFAAPIKPKLQVHYTIEHFLPTENLSSIF